MLTRVLCTLSLLLALSYARAGQAQQFVDPASPHPEGTRGGTPLIGDCHIEGLGLPQVEQLFAQDFVEQDSGHAKALSS